MRIEKADEGRGWKDGRKEGESREVARSQISGNPDTQRKTTSFLEGNAAGTNRPSEISTGNCLVCGKDGIHTTFLSNQMERRGVTCINVTESLLTDKFTA